MPVQPRLETNRLILRALTPDDAATLQVIASARAIADTTISVPHPYLEGEASRYIARKQAEFQAGRAVTFAIAPKPELGLQGMIELRDIEREHGQAELSFWLAVDAWGQGYMSEAVAPVLQFGFETLGLNRICAYHMVRNPASGKVLQKHKFVPEGVLRQRVRKWGMFEDTVLLALLAQDWQQTQSA